MRNKLYNTCDEMPAWKHILAQFEAHLQQSEMALSTIAAYLNDVRSFALWLRDYVGQDTAPSEFSSCDVQAYMEFLRHVLGRTPAGINRRLQSLRKFGRFAVMTGLRDTNPAQKVRLLAGPVLTAMPRSLTEEEVRKVVESAEDGPPLTAARDLAILQLLLQTGIRVSELVQLRQADIDLADGHSTVMIGAHGKVSARQLPLNEAARLALYAYLQQARPADATSVFLNRRGGPLSVRSVQWIVATMGRVAGLEVSARTLRDTYATRLWRETGDLKLLSERLGHKRPEAALKYLSPLPTIGVAMEVS